MHARHAPHNDCYGKYVSNTDLIKRAKKVIAVAFDSIENRIDRRWVPAAQSFEKARKDILTLIRALSGEWVSIQRPVSDYWMQSSTRATVYGIALEVFHVLNDLGYTGAARLYKALKLHVEVNKGHGPEDLFRYASPEKAAALIHSNNQSDYARTYVILKFGSDLSGTIDADTARKVLNRHQALWFVYPDATYHIHLIREGIWLDIVVPDHVIAELRLDATLARQIRQAERDSRGASS